MLIILLLKAKSAILQTQYFFGNRKYNETRNEGIYTEALGPNKLNRKA